MPQLCCVIGCNNSRGSPRLDLPFHSFPADRPRRKKWVAAVNRGPGWKVTQNSRVCGDHFVSGQKSDDPSSPDFVPSVFPQVSVAAKNKAQRKYVTFTVRRNETIRKLRKQKQKADEANTTKKAEASAEEEKKAILAFKEDQDLFQASKAFSDHPEKVDKLTGLRSYPMFRRVLDLISPHLMEIPRLSPLHQLLLSLMKLRLNFTSEYLSDVFKVDKSTVDKSFLHVIQVLNEKLVPSTLIWPEKSERERTLPFIFKSSYSECVSVIDFFEIRVVDDPSEDRSPDSAAPSVKPMKTVKYLISVLPHGFVNFVSKGYGGDTNDAQLIVECGYLNNLAPSDVVLATKHFNVADSVAKHGARLETPAQLNPFSENKLPYLATIIVHVKNLIGIIRKKYTYFDSPIPNTLIEEDVSGFTELDKMVRVACALINICEPVEKVQISQ